MRVCEEHWQEHCQQLAKKLKECRFLQGHFNIGKTTFVEKKQNSWREGLSCELCRAFLVLLDSMAETVKTTKKVTVTQITLIDKGLLPNSPLFPNLIAVFTRLSTVKRLNPQFSHCGYSSISSCLAEVRNSWEVTEQQSQTPKQSKRNLNILIISQVAGSRTGCYMQLNEYNNCLC